MPIFGRHLVAEVPFGLKYALATELDAGRAHTMIDRHGLVFVQLYARQPAATVHVAQNPRYHELFQHVLLAERPDEALLFFERLLGLVGSLMRCRRMRYCWPAGYSPPPRRSTFKKRRWKS